MNNQHLIHEPLHSLRYKMKIPTVSSPVSSSPHSPVQSIRTSLVFSPIKPPLQNKKCTLCQKNYNFFTPLISHSLYCKYSSSHNLHLYHYHTKQIQQIVQQALSPAYITYRDNVFYNEDDQNLKRFYHQSQYRKKINMLSEYYKFHRNLPVWNSKGVQQAMNRYYAKIKDVDYKKIKQVLKKQQGISLTTHKSFSSMEEQSQFTKKSRYSTMLNDLQHSNDSIVLRDLCDKIGKALKKVKAEDDFKGTYYSGQKKFQQFMQKQKKRRESKVNLYQLQEQNTQRFNFKKIKQKKLHTKADQIEGLKEIVFGSNHSLKDKKQIPIRNVRNSQKQSQNHKQNIKIRLKQKQIKTINDTHSRQITSRKQRNKSANQIMPLMPVSNRNSINNKDNIQIGNNIKTKLKSMKASLNINLNINQLQKISKKQIQTESYKNLPNQFDQQFEECKLLTQKKKQYQGENQLKKSISTQLLSKSKSRSNSSHDIKTMSNLNNICKDPINSKRQLINSVKMNGSYSKKSIPICAAKGTVIQLGQLKNKKLFRENSQSKSKSKSKEKSLSKQKLGTISTNKIDSKISTTQSIGSHKKPLNNQPIIALNNQLRPHIIQTPSHVPTHTHTQSHSQLQTQNNGQYNTLSGTKKPNCQKSFGKKRNSVVENMLQKKLTAFKRKQPIF